MPLPESGPSLQAGQEASAIYLQSVFENSCFYNGNSPSTSAVMMKRTNIGSAYFIKVFR